MYRQVIMARLSIPFFTPSRCQIKDKNFKYEIMLVIYTKSYTSSLNWNLSWWLFLFEIVIWFPTFQKKFSENSNDEFVSHSVARGTMVAIILKLLRRINYRLCFRKYRFYRKLKFWQIWCRQIKICKVFLNEEISEALRSCAINIPAASTFLHHQNN